MKTALIVGILMLVCIGLLIDWIIKPEPAKVDRDSSAKPRSSGSGNWPKLPPPMPTPGRNQRRKKTNLLHVSKATRRKHRAA